MAERIHIQNYEAWFLDYLEGNLNSEQVKALKAFLEKHPELKEELDNFEMFTLEPETVRFGKKEDLTVNTQAKYFDISDIEYLCIANAEKDTNEDEKRQLQEKIKNDKSIEHELTLYQKANLIPDESIIFKKKKELIKQRTALNSRVISLAAAAVFAGVITLNITGLFNKNKQQPGTYLLSGNRATQNAPNFISENDTEEHSVQGAFISHNQTVKQTNNNDLVFADNEPQTNDNMYKETTIRIPEIKHEALIFSEANNNVDKLYAFAHNSHDEKNNKETIWDYAEKGVNVFKMLSSSELEMNNQYYADGSIEKLRISHPNFKLSRTFYKNKQ